MSHWCHLEQSPPSEGQPAVYAQRAVCECGWSGDWFIAGSRAVEQGTDHARRAARVQPWTWPHDGC
jgi:hypothetical protein